MIPQELKLALYDSWANKMLLRSLDSLASQDERVTHLLGHLTAAKEVWLARTQGEETRTWDLWPKPEWLDAARRLARVDAQWIALAAAAPDFSRAVTYTNQHQQSYSTPLGEILTHVVNHGTYHRGQLATAVKQAGGTPAVSDYIAWLRTFPDCVPTLPAR